MSYLIITYDNESYTVGDEHIKIVQKHWRDKTPFTLYGGKVSLSGGNIKKIEQSGKEDAYHDWNELGGYYRSILDNAKIDTEKSPYCGLVKRNLQRLKDGEKWCYTFEEENALK